MHLPRLYAIVDADLAAAYGWRVPDLASAYLAGGARLLQLRAKHAPSSALLEWADEILREARHRGARVIVNDRADVARLAGADGVHLGQQDLAPAEARALLGTEALVGLSAHLRDQALSGIADPSVSYLAVGPIFETATKASPDPVAGFALVHEAAALASALSPDRARPPIVAIGGITLDRAAEVIDAGADSVAVISDLLVDGDPEDRVRQYVRVLGN